MPRRRFQRGNIITRGKTPKRSGMFREDVLQPDGTFKRQRRCVGLGLAKDLSERAARKLLQPHLDRVNAAIKLPPKSGITFQAFVEDWRIKVAVNLKDSTVRAANSHLRAHLLPKMGHLTLTEINTQAVQGFVSQLTIARKTVENVVLTLSSILRTAKTWGYVAGDFSLRGLTLPREGVKKDPPSLTDEEVVQILNRTPEPYKTIFLVTAVLGLRAGEVLALRVMDVDFRQGIIHIRQSVDERTRKIQSPKPGESRGNVPMPSQLADRLRRFIEAYRPTELLFTNRNGRPYAANKLRQMVLQPILKQLGLPQCGFHAMRHGAASALFADGVNPVLVQKQLRHSDPRITLGIYGHVVGNQQRDAVEHRSARIEAQLVSNG